ncbi:hypothetical protein DMENIID0001_008090 [Sergentomyia squamirostris]
MGFLYRRSSLVGWFALRVPRAILFCGRAFTYTAYSGVEMGRMVKSALRLMVNEATCTNYQPQGREIEAELFVFVWSMGVR